LGIAWRATTRASQHPRDQKATCPLARRRSEEHTGFKYIDAEALLMMMDAEGICVSAGSACKSGSLEPSHVLMAMNVPLSAIHGSVRFCVSRYTNEEEIDTLVQKTAKIVKRLREMSPFGKQDKPAALTREELDRHKAYFAKA
jgi:cysteine desulfurase